MSQLHLINHPMIQHKLTIMRDKETGSKDFRQLLKEISLLMGYEVTRDIPLDEIEIETPICRMTAKQVSGRKLAIVPILRAGLGLMDGVVSMIPGAKVSVVGLFRDEKTLKPVEYYVKLAKDIAHRRAVILDPMLATGGSLCACIELLKRSGCTSICSLHLVCAPVGIERVLKEHPDVDIYTAAVDEKLNDKGYILPGLGDAGDRIFGTR